MFFRNKWKQWGISVIGQSHIENNLPNQDAFIVNFRGNSNKKVLYAAVADGLGSKPRSDSGSKALCRVVKKASRFYKKNSQTSPSDMAMYIQGLWTTEIMKFNPVKFSDFSTTALFVFLYKDNLLVCQLGDGLVCGIFKNEEKNFMLKHGDDDGFANITSSLGPAMSINDWKVGEISCEDLRALVLCTDGISTDIEENALSFVQSLFDEYKNVKPADCLKDAQRWISEWPVKGNLDDKTIVMVTCEERKGERRKAE